MALIIHWTRRADHKFDQILQYLLKEWGEGGTQTFVKQVYEFLNIIVEFPEIGTIENRDKEIRGFVIVKQITVFYKITNKKVILLDFFDNRQHPSKKRF